MIIDAEDLIVGRFATVVAKKALLGETIDIVNSEKAVVTGNYRAVIERFKRKRELGAPRVGPFFPRMPDRIVKRMIRGMFPYKQTRGKEAFKRVMCYIGVPEEFEGKKFETVETAHLKKLPNVKYVRIKDISMELGARI